VELWGFLLGIYRRRQLTSNGFVLCMFVNCKIMKFRHAKYDAFLLFLHVDHDLPG